VSTLVIKPYYGETPNFDSITSENGEEDNDDDILYELNDENSCTNATTDPTDLRQNAAEDDTQNDVLKRKRRIPAYLKDYDLC
jgi:hypothetical protein